jgi:hypothetical protein
MLSEYHYGTRSMIEAYGAAHGEWAQCRAVQRERSVIVVTLLYGCAVHP